MKHKLNKILAALCSSCFAWLAFYNYSVESYLFFGEVKPPVEEE